MDFMKSTDGVEKKIIYAGTGENLQFKEGSKITFHFETQILDGCDDCKHPIDSSKKVGKPMELLLGKQFKMPVWEKCLKTMKIGEVSDFTVKKNLVDAYPLVSKSYREFAGISKGKKGHCCGMMAFAEGVGEHDLDGLIREPKDLKFTLELVKVEQPGEYTKEAWVMDPEEKRESIPKLKELGNQLYTKQQYGEASEKYAEALGLLEQLILREKPGDQEWLELQNIKIPILGNYAQCKLVQKDYYAVIEYTTTVLEKENNNVKALYRRGKAYVGTWDLEMAREDFNRVAELDPSFKTVIQKELKHLNVLQKQKDEEMKAKLFGKDLGKLDPT